MELRALAWNITNNCNLQCIHCYVSAGLRTAYELDFAEVSNVVKQAREVGIEAIHLAGGEPLLRSDIIKICAFIHKEGISPILISNGTLMTNALARRIRKAGVVRVQIGFDGAHATFFDKFRNREGTFKEVIRGIRACTNNGIQVSLDFTLTSYNALEIESFHSLAVKLGVQKATMKRFIPIGRGLLNAKLLSISAKQLRLWFTKWFQISRDSPIELEVHDPLFDVFCMENGLEKEMKSDGCIAARHWLGIQSNGIVTPCPLVPVSLGNLRKQSLKSIINNMEGSYVVEDTRCLNCTLFPICHGGCRAAAYAVTGNLESGDPMCWRLSAN